MRTIERDHGGKDAAGRGSARSEREDGFTLVELLITMGIALVLLIGIGGMIDAGARSSTAAFNLVRMETSSNEVMNTIARQIRVASHVDPESNIASITFTGDLRGDGVQRTQSFYVEDGELFRDGQPWVDGVSGITFTYYHYDKGDKEEEVLVPGSYPGWNEAIHRVEMKITMSRPSTGVDLDRTYRGSVTIMNALR